MAYNIKLNSIFSHPAIAPLALCVIVALFWTVFAGPLRPRDPEYNYSEVEAISKVNIFTMWFWTDYKSYHRYSPTGLLFIGLIDRYIIAPLCGIDFSDLKQAFRGGRLVPILYLDFVLIALLTYWFAWELFGNKWVSLISGLYMGVNKAFFYFFYYADSLALTLFVIYAICVLIYWNRYVKFRRPLYLIGYYIFFILAVGAWEQWINLLGFIILFSVFISARERKWDKKIILNGIIIPLVIFSIYAVLRYPTMISEISAVKEAQYVFSYPAKTMMLEDVIVNASLHISDTIDSLLFPWPMLSQSVIHNFNMDQWNAFDKTYAPYPSMHYRFLADWYAGLLFALFFVITVLFIVYVRRAGKEAYKSCYGGLIGMFLVWTGFIVHWPVMYRSYFAMPGYLLGYKHIMSILGFSIFLGWALKKLSENIKKPNTFYALCLILCVWIISCNYWKIALSHFRFYPW